MTDLIKSHHSAQSRETERRLAREWYSANRVRALTNARNHYLRNRNNPEWINKRHEAVKIWRSKNAERKRECQRIWISKNRWRLRGYKKRTKKSNASRAIDNLRNRLRKIVKGKVGGCIGLSGCSRDQLRRHLEAGFQGRMSWENYGRTWVIDHLLPCASFDLSAPQERKACFHWTNLRPMLKRANRLKWAKITQPQQQLMLDA